MSGVDGRGRPKFQTRYHFLIRNDGDAAAENLTFEFVPIGAGEEPPEAFDATPVSRLAPRGSLSWPLIAHMGTAFQWDVVLRWEEDGIVHEDRQTVRLS